jgi:hypothetical protein
MKILLELNDQNIPAGESKVDTIWQEYSLGGYIQSFGFFVSELSEIRLKGSEGLSKIGNSVR